MNQISSALSNTRELAQVAHNAQEVIARADTVFPFTLFKDTITIDRVKVTIKQRYYFQLANTTSIQIEDILNAEVNTGPLFGSLRLWTRFYVDHPLIINYLTNQDALVLKRVLQGFVIARQKEVDCANIDLQKLTSLLHELGQEANG